MLDQEAKEQQPSETLPSVEPPQSILVELSEEDLLEAVTGGGGVFSQPKAESSLQGVFVRTPSGNLMRSPHGNLIVAMPRSITEPPLPVHPSSESSSSGQATSHGGESPTAHTMENIFVYLL